MDDKRLRVARPVLIAATLATIFWVSAGDLNPPAGPIAPTQRTPIGPNTTPGDADSLFKISVPGSYYLTGNITGVPNEHGIEITVSGVTLDLNGFDLAGVAGMGAFDGVSVTVANLTSIAVVNGSVRNWGGGGVDLGTLAAANCRVADVLATGNAASGISTGDGCTITNCSVFQNAIAGIATGNFGCTVSNCTANQNTGTGISVGRGSTVSNCAANNNTFTGISALDASTISNCSASYNGDGITANFQSMVADCTVHGNVVDGILCAGTCLIRGNTCTFNGNGGDGAGIHVTSNRNRIEDNNCVAADRGIDVDFAGNIIIKNTCSGNGTNWAIAANNYYGPIVDRTGVATPAVNGAAAASTLATTDPNANFSY